MIRHNSTQHNSTQQKQPRSVAPVYALKGPCQVFLSTLWKANIHIYYSTLAPFYHIRSRECAKYATVLHSKIMYCSLKSRFHRFSGRRTGKTIFWRDFFKWNNISLIRWLNIQYAWTFCSLLVIFLARSGLGKILRNLQNIRAYYMLNHRIRCTYIKT